MKAATHTRIESIRHAGLKAFDRKHVLGPCTVISGPNGAGKSTVLNALALLATGECLGFDRNYEGIMSLARGPSIIIEGEITLPDGRRARVTRTWKRDRSGKISQKIENTVFNGALKEHEAWLRDHLGGMPEAWDPTIFWTLSPAKMRERLLRILPKSETALASIVPADCPEWALPKHFDPEPEIWARNALAKAREHLARYQAGMREVEVELAQTEHGWPGEKPIAPIQEKLAAHRRTLLDLRERNVSTPRLAKLRARQTELSSAVDTEAPDLIVVRLACGLVEAAVTACRVGFDKLSAERSKQEKAKADAQRALTDLGPGVQAATPEALAELTLEFEANNQSAATLATDLRRLEKELKGIDDAPVPRCPNCQHNLAEAVVKARAEKAADLASVRAELEVINGVQKDVVLARNKAIAGVKMVAAQVALLEARRAIAEVDANIAELPARKDGASTWPAVDDAEFAANAAHDAALQASQVRAEFARLATDIARIEADLAKLTTTERTAEAIEAEIKALEGEIVALTEANQVAQRLLQAKEDQINLEKQIEEAKGWIHTFAAIQSELVAQAKDWIERGLSEAGGGSKVVVEMYDARGNDDCRFTVDGVSVETLSPGKRLPFTAALIVVLASASDAAWKPLIIDEIEHISHEYREPFLRAVKSAVESGAVSQSIIAGCPDEVPEIDGINHIEIGPETLKVVA